MALRGALEHPKTLALADALGIMDCFALGVLEAFWHHVGKYHEDGDVTNLKPSVMARSIRYTGDAQILWDSLKESGFLDDIDGKVIVHGWSERADDATQAKMYRAVKRFADGTQPKARSVGKHEREKLEHAWTIANNELDSERTVDGQFENVLPVPVPVPVPEPVNKETSTPSNGREVVPHSGQFAKPSLDEVHTQAQILGISSDEAERFWIHYEAQNWIVGNGLPAGSWVALLQKWKLSAKQNPNRGSPRNSRPSTLLDIRDRIVDEANAQFK